MKLHALEDGRIINLALVTKVTQVGGQYHVHTVDGDFEVVQRPEYDRIRIHCYNVKVGV